MGSPRGLLLQAPRGRSCKPCSDFTGHTPPSLHTAWPGGHKRRRQLFGSCGGPKANILEQGPRPQSRLSRPEGKRKAASEDMRAGASQRPASGLCPLTYFFFSAPPACLPRQVPSSPWLLERRSKPKSRRICPSGDLRHLPSKS